MAEVHHDRRAGMAVPLPDTELSTAELVKEITAKVKNLAMKEIELAKIEVRKDLKEELVTVKGLGAAALCALFGINMLFVCAALALGTVMAEWLAALLVGVVLLAAGAIAGLFGWSKRVKAPLKHTRKTLEEDVAWAKRKLA
jgi:uncharacterized membrane protein YqjE